jgi:hypothetical protein
MLFPWGLPFPTAFYLTLYVLTFALNQAFMHYVLAGSLYVAWTMVFPKNGDGPGEGGVSRSEQPLAAILRDWMPFLLSAAITAGVAPLLFIQIVYQRQFYSTNLLLFWRWMAVVPVLIAAFYLLYLIKSSIMNSWSRTLRGSVATLTAGCFVFVGFCWTVNYLLGLNESKWPEIYVTGQMPFAISTLFFRMLIWIGASFASMSAIVAWQMLALQTRQKELDLSVEIQRLVTMSIGGLLVFSLAGLEALAESTREIPYLIFGSSEVSPYLLLTVVGILMQARGWWLLRGLKQLTGKRLYEISIGAVLTLLGMSFIREAVRTNMIDLSSQYQKHAEAAKVGGFAVFLIFTVVVTLVIIWCIRIVQDGLAQTKPE